MMISVIVPVFNSERWLGECIESILAQSYRDIELLLVDDGSTDMSATICDRYADSDNRVRVFHTGNCGPAAARNFALDRIRGEFICFVDSDDILLPDALRNLHSIADRTGAGIVEGRIIKQYALRQKDYAGLPEPSEISFSADAAIESCLYQGRLRNGPWSKLFRRNLFDGVRFREGIIYEDLDLIYRLHDIAGHTVYTSAPVYFYRKVKSSITNTFNTRRLDVLDVVKRMERYIALRHPGLLPAAHDRALSANFNIFWLATAHRADMPGTLDRCWDEIRRLRRGSLTNPKVRAKNKAAIILSYLGRTAFSIVCRCIKSM